jgi:molybdenum cofactor cytidylyltransferase
VVESIVLAAGASSRMGRPKASLPLTNAGETFLSHLCRTLLDAGLSRVTVITGAHPGIVADSWPAGDARVRAIHNPHWSSGQLSSLLVGLDAIDDGQVEAMIVGLVDVPLVRASTVRVLIDTWRETRAPIVRPSRDGHHGHPVIFDRAIFAELRAADPTHGAKPVVHAHLDRLIDVCVDDEGAFLDADTEDEYKRLLDVSHGRSDRHR